jgi:hypothetical protein
LVKWWLVALVACGGGKKPAGEDAARAASRDAAIPDAGSAGPAVGEAAIRVEWKAVPTIARQSPGKTPCNTPRAAQVAPTTMWGIPDAIVLTDKAPAPGTARIVLADCALTPRIAIAKELVVESALDRPAKLTLTKHGTIGSLGSLTAGEARAIQLPIAGHAVAIALEPDTVYRLAIDADEQDAWIVNAPGGVTDAGGLATLKLPSGSHDVTAWLPSRGGQDWKVVKSKVTVETGQLAELSIDLGPR